MADGQGTTGKVTRPLFLGIDLSGGEVSLSTWAILDSEPRLLWWGYASDDELVALAQEPRAAVIAIDAPLSLPRGLCCLEESCPCHPSLPLSGRAAERELSRLGIPSFYVTKRTFIKAMVYRGIKLRKGLEGQGHRVIEVYPYASKVILWGRALPKKQGMVGRRFLAERLRERVAGLDIFTAPPSHDILDAIVAAYTGYLGERGLTAVVGDTEEGVVYIPVVAGQKMVPAEGVEPTTKGL